jgi:hypothetical protein
MKDLKYTLLVALLLALGAAGFRLVYAPRGNGSGGIDVAKGTVVNIKQRKNDLWRVEVYVGEIRTRMPNGELDQSAVYSLYVDGKAKNPYTGRLVIEELRELLVSHELVHIRANWKEGVCTEVSIQKGLGTRLKVQD